MIKYELNMRVIRCHLLYCISIYGQFCCKLKCCKSEWDVSPLTRKWSFYIKPNSHLHVKLLTLQLLTATYSKPNSPLLSNSITHHFSFPLLRLSSACSLSLCWAAACIFLKFLVCTFSLEHIEYKLLCIGMLY